MAWTIALAIVALIYIALTHRCTHRIERQLMSVQDQINALVEQLRKSKDEIVTRLGEAEASIGSQLVDAGVEVDLSELTNIAQALDDIVPDAVDVTTLPDEAVGVTTLPGEAVGVTTLPGDAEANVSTRPAWGDDDE